MVAGVTGGNKWADGRDLTRILCRSQIGLESTMGDRVIFGTIKSRQLLTTMKPEAAENKFLDSGREGSWTGWVWGGGLPGRSCDSGWRDTANQP